MPNPPPPPTSTAAKCSARWASPPPAASLLAGTVSGADVPAPASRTAAPASRSTSLRGIPCGPKTFIKIETDKNVIGWGEVTGCEPKVAAVLAESLFELLDGENPTRVEHLWQKLFRSHRDMRGGSIMVHVISGIDMALWDITGKLWGVPVYRLLGGPAPRQGAHVPQPQGHQARHRRPAPLLRQPRPT